MEEVERIVVTDMEQKMADQTKRTRRRDAKDQWVGEKMTEKWTWEEGTTEQVMIEPLEEGVVETETSEERRTTAGEATSGETTAEVDATTRTSTGAVGTRGRCWGSGGEATTWDLLETTAGGGTIFFWI